MFQPFKTPLSCIYIEKSTKTKPFTKDAGVAEIEKNIGHQVYVQISLLFIYF